MPDVKVNTWITVGESNIHAYVFTVRSETEVSAGYYQNKAKEVKEDFVWDGACWNFKGSGVSASYLRGHDAAIVRNGPPMR